MKNLITTLVYVVLALALVYGALYLLMQIGGLFRG